MDYRQVKPRCSFKLPTETFAEPVILVLNKDTFAMALEKYPFAAPVFIVTKRRTQGGFEWSAEADYTIKFTEAMLARTDVTEFIVTANSFVDTSSLQTLRDTVTRLLNHWATTFPQGVPDRVM